MKRYPNLCPIAREYSFSLSHNSKRGQNNG
jgi:hypothetical protein